VYILQERVPGNSDAYSTRNHIPRPTKQLPKSPTATSIVCEESMTKIPAVTTIARQYLGVLLDVHLSSGQHEVAIR